MTELDDRLDVDRSVVEARSHQPARVSGALWRRLVARLLDMFTTFFLTFALVVLVFVWFMDGLTDAVQPDPWGRGFVALVLYILVMGVYEVVFVSQRGQTPGKDVMNLKVISVSTGAAPSVRVAALRFLPLAVLRLVPGAGTGTVVLFLLGVTSPADHRRRAVHDLVAATMVISYDADLEEGDGSAMAVDPERLAEVYGPRSWWQGALRRRPSGERP